MAGAGCQPDDLPLSFPEGAAVLRAFIPLAALSRSPMLTGGADA